MPFQIVRNDITLMPVDAIVNAAKPSLLGGGGVDGAIHRAAGPELLEACRALGSCAVGEAKLTPGFRLPAKYVIHTVGPVWHGGFFGERRQLASCYRSVLTLAKEQECESIAFPLISAGSYGYPKEKALRVAVEEISTFLLENDMAVYLAVYGGESLALSRKLFADVQEYIDEHYVEEHPPLGNRREEPGDSIALNAAMPCGSQAAPEAKPPRPAARRGQLELEKAARPKPSFDAQEATLSLNSIFNDLDESFQQMLLRKIDESGMTDAQCYKKANIDRKLFSKIRKDVHYKPSKATALAFAVALELDLRETKSLLEKAGFALSRSSRFDVIVQYFIERHNYNIYEINETLFYYDQSLLG